MAKAFSFESGMNELEALVEALVVEPEQVVALGLVVEPVLALVVVLVVVAWQPEYHSLDRI